MEVVTNDNEHLTVLIIHQEPDESLRVTKSSVRLAGLKISPRLHV